MFEWDGDKLYVHRHGQRVFVGEVVKALFADQWHVSIRGFCIYKSSDEESARRELEKASHENRMRSRYKAAQ